MNASAHGASGVIVMDRYEFAGFDLAVCGRGEALIVVDKVAGEVRTVTGSEALRLLDAIAEEGVKAAVGSYLAAV